MYWIQVSVLYIREIIQHVLDSREAVQHVLDTGQCTVQQKGSIACTGYRSVYCAAGGSTACTRYRPVYCTAGRQYSMYWI